MRDSRYGPVSSIYLGTGSRRRKSASIIQGTKCGQSWPDPLIAPNSVRTIDFTGDLDDLSAIVLGSSAAPGSAATGLEIPDALPAELRKFGFFIEGG